MAVCASDDRFRSGSLFLERTHPGGVHTRLRGADGRGLAELRAGPRHPVPWASEEEMATATDALPDGGIFPIKPELRLLTPLHQG
jgi:hypothetical protein